MNRRWRGIGLGWSKELRALLDFLPLILGSILIALAATTAGSASTHCLFQSPVSPVSPLPIESPVVPSPVMPQETAVSPTATPPALTAVATPPDFIPWVIGLLVIIIVVGVLLYWRSRRKGGEGSA